MHSTRPFSRRKLLQLSMAALAGAGGVTVGAQVLQTQRRGELDLTEPIRPRSVPEVPEDAPLKEHAAAKGILYGAASNYPILSSDTEFAEEHFVRECGILVPENALKWNVLRPNPNTWNFTRSDWLAEFAQSHGLLFRGHTLIGQRTFPEWVSEVINQQNAEQLLVDHITTVASRYAGTMHSWDVVNEVVSEWNSDRPDRLQEQIPWLEFLGPDYIDLAFRVAVEADPQALLVLNDNGMEHTTPAAERKRQSILKLLERLVSAGTPIQALGMQAHLFRFPRENQFNANKLSQFLEDVSSLGLKILITELDVTDQHLPLDVATRDRQIADIYEEFLSIILDQPAVIAVLTWGLSDRYTWLNRSRPREDGNPSRPLPLDVEFNRKPVWQSMVQAFDRAPLRAPLA